jgi:DNA-binding MarR family transcriptional regulator
MNELYDLPGHLVRRLQQIAVAIFISEVTEAGFDLTPVQYAALSMVEARPGIDQAKLAGHIAHDRNTIGGVVDRLVQKNYLVREVSDRDRRARELRLTAEGVTLLRQVAPSVERAQSVILSGLDPDEQAVFMALLRKATSAANDRSRAPLKSLTSLS